MGRAWILGITILVVGLAGEREDGLMAALLALVAFTVYLATTLVLAPHGEEHAQLMSKTRKILFGVLGGYLLLTVLAFIVFGSAGRNEEFAPQDEFTLYTWIDLPGSLDINKAVLYLVLSGILTCGSMVYIANRMQARPNRIQTAVEVAVRPDARQHHPREHGRQDGGEVLPVHRDAVPVHLVQQPDRVHPAADRAREVLAVRPGDPDLRDLRGDGQRVRPARARR